MYLYAAVYAIGPMVSTYLTGRYDERDRLECGSRRYRQLCVLLALP